MGVKWNMMGTLTWEVSRKTATGISLKTPAFSMDYIMGLISIWPSCGPGSIPPVRGLLGNIPYPVGAEIKGHTPLHFPPAISYFFIYTCLNPDVFLWLSFRLHIYYSQLPLILRRQISRCHRDKHRYIWLCWSDNLHCYIAALNGNQRYFLTKLAPKMKW